MKLPKFLSVSVLALVTVTACNSSILSNSNTTIDTVTAELNKQTNLGLQYAQKMPGIAGGNIEGGEVGNFPNGDASVMVFRYSSPDGAKNFEKVATNNCQSVVVKGLFLFCFMNDNPVLKKAVNAL